MLNAQETPLRLRLVAAESETKIVPETEASSEVSTDCDASRDVPAVVSAVSVVPLSSVVAVVPEDVDQVAVEALLAVDEAAGEGGR